MPRFNRLAAGDVEEKSPGEVVTIVDREVEAFLSRELQRLVPGSIVIGEEACAAEPSLLEQVDARRVWLLDPLDGTGNFIAGRGDHAVLVALLDRGECVSSWMYRPADRVLYRAERGAGAWTNGVRVAAPAAAAPPRLRGIVKTRFLPDGLRESVTSRAQERLADVQSGANCTAVDYPRIVAGECDFALYWRTLPWDHASPALWLEEAGGCARRPDGSRYRLGEPRDGLIVAASEACWHMAREALMDGDHPA